ncbi:MAG TPA: TonB family protein [Pyrinomonadaceae bacterium]|jgi:protein TonB|nr:TonB family protein [Pyrinomonadaceae bacterium]
MFNHLIESGSHARDLKRRGTFFLGTLAFYGVLLSVAGIGSIYAYNASLDEPNLDIVTMIRFSQPAASVPERRAPERPAAARSSAANQLTTRPEISVITPYQRSKVASMETKEVRAGVAVRISPNTSDPVETGGPVGPRVIGDNYPAHNEGGVRLAGGDKEDEPPLTPRVKAAVEKLPEVKKTVVSLGPINSRAIDKPIPVYPPIARAAKASGTVVVQILLDETGKVVSAQATSGHPLLKQAAVQAAYRARFTPTYLSNQPIKATGYITYNFILQ